MALPSLHPSTFILVRIRTHEEGRVSLLPRCGDIRGFKHKERCPGLRRLKPKRLGCPDFRGSKCGKVL